MPIVKVPHTDAERKAMINAGVNPDDYENSINTDDFEDITAPPVSLTPQAPAIKPEPYPDAPTPLGSAARAFGANVLPASAGVFTGTVAPLALGIANPIAGIAASILGGVGGYAGAKKLQDTLMPFSWEQKLERDKRENPGSVTLGNIAAQLPTMRPSIKGIMDTIKGVPNLARSKATLDEVNAVRNTMMGAGMGAAGSVVGDVKPYLTGDLTGWDLTKNMARATVLGSLLNTPTALGNKFGQAATKVGQGINFKFKPTLEPTVEDPTSVMQRPQAVPESTLPVVDAEIVHPTEVKPTIPIEDFHTPESKVAAAEIQAKTVKAQEDTAKLIEEGNRLQVENANALAAKDKAAAELVKQSQAVATAPKVASTPSSQYDLLTQEMKTYDFDTPEYQKLWAEREKIKNANGGMPPVAITQTEEPKAKVEESLATITEPVKQTVSDRPFITTAEREISDPSNPLKLTKFKDGGIDARTVGPRLRNRLHPDEWQSLKDAGIEEFLAKQINVKPEDLAKWVEENALKVEHHTYGMGSNASVAKHTADAIQHNLDTLGWKVSEYGKITKQGSDLEYGYDNPNVPKEVIEKAIDYAKLMEHVRNEPKDTSPRATSAYHGVSSSDTKKYGMTRSDVVIIPDKESKQMQDRYSELVDKVNRTEAEKFEMKQLENRAKKIEKTLWQQDNLHENLPNTFGWSAHQLMAGSDVIEGEKLGIKPDEKIVKLEENQSRWAQGMQMSRSRMIERGATPEEADKYIKEGKAFAGVVPGDNHLILQHNVPITLKALIRDALKNDAKYVFLPDSNTAMITEGHDLGTLFVTFDPQKLSNEVREREYIEQDRKEPIVVQQSYIDSLPENIAKALEDSVINKHVKQEKGMKLHYDVTLPSAMKKLLGGQDGVRVSLGEHKNVLQDTKRNREIDEFGNTAQELNQMAVLAGEDPYGKFRSNLVLKTPSGEFHTQITGKLYDISKVDASKPFDVFSMASLVPKTQAQAKSIAPTPKPQPLQPSTQPASVSEVPKGTSVEVVPEKLVTQAVTTTKHEAEQFPLKLAESGGSNVPPVIPPTSNVPPVIPPSDEPPTTPTPYDKFEPYDVEKDNSLQSVIDFDKFSLAAQFRQVRRKNVPVAEAFENAKADMDALVGRFVNQPVEALMKTKAKEEEMTSAMKKMNKAYRDEVIHGITPPADIGLTPREKEVQAIISKTNAEVPTEAKDRGMSINGFFTADSLKPNYIPASVDPERLYEINKNPDGVPARRYARVYAEYLQENFPNEFSNDAEGYAKARKQWTDYIAAVNSKNSQAPSDFGPLHKAQGYGLPEELQDWNLPRVMSKYGHRAAQDMAVHTNMKMKPEIAGPLQLRHQGNGQLITKDPRHTDITGTDEVKGAWKHLTGDFDYGNQTLATTSRVITSHMIGLMTGVGDVVSVPMNMVPYMDRMGDLVASIKGILSLRDAFNRAIAVNATQRKLDARLWANMETPGRPVLSALQRWADIVRLVSLREATDQLSRVIPFSIGREMVKIRIMDYVKTGNEDSKKWLEMFGRNVEGGVLMVNPANGELIGPAIEQIAKNFSDRVAGSYGGDQLSAGVMDGWAAPFTTLAKWSLAKQNVIFQDVIKPAYTHGDVGPLLRYMFIGMPLAYAAYTALQELMTHRKMSSPNLKEVMEKGNVADDAAYLANVMAVTSAGGIASYPIKAITDLTIRHTTPTFSLNNPMITFMSENIAKTLKNVSEALAEGEDPLHVWGDAAMSIVKHSVQNARMFLNQTVDRKQNETSNKIRDLNVYNELGDAADNPDRNTMAKEIGLASNPLLKRGEKDFKNEQDLTKAAEMIPKLLQKIDKEAKGDPMRRKKLIDGLMNSKDSTFPSMHSSTDNGKLAIEYSAYLSKVYGKEEALARVRDAELRELTQMGKKQEVMKAVWGDTNFVAKPRP